MVLWFTGATASVSLLAKSAKQLLSTRSTGRWFFLDSTGAEALLQTDAPTVAQVSGLCDALSCLGNSVLCWACQDTSETMLGMAGRPGYIIVPWNGQEGPGLHPVDGASYGGDYTEIALSLLDALSVPLDAVYPYDQEDRLQKPHKYQYTPYEGRKLLESYQVSRQAHISRFEAALSALRRAFPPPANSPQNAFGNAFETLFPGVGRFWKPLLSPSVGKTLETVSLFANLLQSTLCGSLTEEEEELILRFLKKFEVGKKFFTGYFLNTYLKARDEWDLPLLYLLFANLLALWTQAQQSAERKAIGMNALLKLCDTIASAASRLYTPLELVLAHRAFALEQQLYRSYQSFTEGGHA